VRIAFLSCNARTGDAIGNQLAEQVAFFRERGADVRVFIEDDRLVHPAIQSCCDVLTPPHEPHGPTWDFLTACDLVFVAFGQHFGLLDFVPLLMRRRVRLIFHYHGITPAHLWGAHNREAIERGSSQRGLVWCADTALVHSRFAANELRGPTGFPNERIACLGHPIIPAWLAAREGSDLRQRLGLVDARLLLFVGRMAPNKRLAVLIEALARFRSNIPPVHALIVGDDTDTYQTEAERCRQFATELGVADRLHFLGHVDDARLRDCYAAADVFVSPSLHEGFGIPVIEAMASGVAVIAARAAALPETVASAGLTFRPDDSADLARQIERVLASRAVPGQVDEPTSPMRIAVVVNHFADDHVGGAEAALGLMARTLQRAGHAVEVFTTGSELTKPTVTEQDGLIICRFAVQSGDPEEQAAALQRIEQGPQAEREAAGQAFLAGMSQATDLIAELERRTAEFDAMLVGPYLSGLTYQVARRWPERTILVPCFHDEPAARLECFQDVYREVGGILYHSVEEQHFAEADLGVNHPNALCAGTVVDVRTLGNSERGHKRVGTGQRYVVYCGRYTSEKGLGLLLELAQRYAVEHPERFTFVFMGDGAWPIPAETWARDLGHVEGTALRDVLAGASALVQLSRRESLSLVALEAWSQGVPVLAHAAAAVMAGHMQRANGGRLIQDHDDFAAALDDLWHDPQRWQQLGQNGLTYVREHYASESAFLHSLEETICGLREPLHERMRRRGRQRAEEFQRERWREQFAEAVEEWLHAPPRPLREALEIQPRCSERRATAGTPLVLLPLRVVNRGTHAIVADGPGRVVVRWRLGETGAVNGAPLPALLVPEATAALTLHIPVPAETGVYSIVLWAECADDLTTLPLQEVRVPLIVGATASKDTRRPSAAAPEALQESLAVAERLQRLPDDYLDVTQGWFATWKRAIKRKLLNNFKRAYVDVAMRQQSAFNQHVVTALNELAESVSSSGRMEDDPSRLRELLAESQRRCADLEERLARLEACLPQEEVPS
jgi:glycosyltransferase involved in cell wall biosynthesis